MTIHRGHQKHERKAIEAVEGMHPELSAAIETRDGQSGHSWLVVTFQGERVRITMPSSPSQPELVPRNARQTTRREFLKKGITL